MIVSSRQNGMVSYKVLFILLLLFIVIHVGVKLAPMYMTAEGMKDEMITKARFPLTLQDEEIIASLVWKAKELGLPLGTDNFKLTRDEATHRIKISATWDIEQHFFYDVYPPFTVKTFHFAPIVEEDYAKKL